MKDMPIKDYIFLRIGRLYPMHIFMLLGFVILELTKFVIGPGQPFDTEYKSPVSLLANIFLIHGLNIFDVATWNGPSWSISVEFYTYILYALLLAVFRKKILWLAVAAIIIVPITFWLSHHVSVDHMTSRYAFSRCLYGFSLGLLCHAAYVKFREKFQSSNAAEILCLAMIILFVSFCGDDRISFFTPWIFGIAVFVFAQEKGAVSRILRGKYFMALGALSYSIYMTHTLLLVCLENVLGKLGLIGNLNLWVGDMLQILSLIGVIAVSAFTYRWIETPANNWFRNYVRRKHAPKVVAEPVAAF